MSFKSGTPVRILLEGGEPRPSGKVRSSHSRTCPDDYLLLGSSNRWAGQALEALDWLLASFLVAPATHEIYARARTLDFSDFEDGVVAAMAEHLACD